MVFKGISVWALVNNAGVPGQGGPDDWLTTEDYRKALEINLLGVGKLRINPIHGYINTKINKKYYSQFDARTHFCR